MISWDKVRFDPKCKLCKLYSINKNLFDEIHEMILHIGFSYERATRYANVIIEKLNREGTTRIEFFNRVNFSTHFRNHLPIDVITALKVRKASIYPVCVTNETVEKTLQEIADDAVKSNISGYERYAKFLDNFERRVSELDKYIDDVGLDLRHAKDYVALVHELRSMQAEQIKLNNSNTFISLVVGKVLENFTEGSLRRVHDVLDQIKDDIAKIDKTLANRTIHRVQSAIEDGMEISARSAIESAKKQFNVRI